MEQRRLWYPLLALSGHAFNRAGQCLLSGVERTSFGCAAMSANDGGLNRSTQHFIFEGQRWSVTMEQRFSRGFTAAEKTELWDRWQRGDSLKATGRAFGKPSSSIYTQVAPHGGIRPTPRRRSRSALTLAEREEISRGLAAHQSARSIARSLGRSASTVSRELSRNGGYNSYRAALAHRNGLGPSSTPETV